MNIKINTLHIHLSDSFFAADAHDPDHTADALDPEVFTESPDPVMPDEEPETSGLDPQQEIAAAIAVEIANRAFHKHHNTGPGTIVAPSWLEAIVETILRTAEDNAVARLQA